MGQGDDPTKEESRDALRKPRNWSEWRDWANVALAFAALLVSVVSVWFTIQISGLEDYFRSEISCRNAELENASLEAQRLAERVERSTQRLENLRTIADRYSVASAEAQISLIDSREKLLQSRSGLQTAREHLIQLQTAIADREGELDAFRRSEVYQLFLFASLRENPIEANDHLGDLALREMSNFGLSNSDAGTAALYEAVRTVGPRLCRHLRSFNPSFPAEMEMPKLGRPPGKPTGDGTYLMTDAQHEEWKATQEAWSENSGAVFEYNSSILEARSAASDYIRDSVWHCACKALNVTTESCRSIPERPVIDTIIATRPNL